MDIKCNINSSIDKQFSDWWINTILYARIVIDCVNKAKKSWSGQWVE